MKITQALKMGLPIVCKGILLKRRAPFLTHLALTYRCNLRCSYCTVYGHLTRANPDLEMTTDQIKGLIDDAAAMGCVKFGLGGGEPFMHPDVEEIGYYAQDKGINVVVTTNGTLLDRHQDFVKAMDLTVVSLDGGPGVNETQRGNAMYDRIVDNLRRTRAAGTKLILNAVITRKHDFNLGVLFDLAKELRCLVAVQPVTSNNANAACGARDLMLSPEQSDALLGSLAKLKRQGAPLYFPAHLYEYMRAVCRGERKPRPCVAGRLMVDIDPSGNIMPCFHLYDENNKNNLVAKGGFRKAFAEIPEKTCASCEWLCYWHNNLIFGLDPPTIWNGVLHL